MSQEIAGVAALSVLAVLLNAILVVARLSGSSLFGPLGVILGCAATYEVIRGLFLKKHPGKLEPCIRLARAFAALSFGALALSLASGWLV